MVIENGKDERDSHYCEEVLAAAFFNQHWTESDRLPGLLRKGPIEQ